MATQFMTKASATIATKDAQDTERSPRRAKVCFIVSEDWFFVSHFLPMLRAAQACDLDVVVITRVRDHGALITATGAHLVSIEGNRATRSPLLIVRTMYRLVRILAHERPDVVHLIALWGILLGGLAATLTRVPARVVALTGRGHFAARKGWRADLLWRLFKALTRGPVSTGNVRYLFENTADVAALGLDAADPRVILVGGAGIDPQALQPQPLPPLPPLKVAIVARMLFSKGIDLAVEAVVLARSNGGMIELDLYGAPDPANPGAISHERLAQWSGLDGIRWHGPSSDVSGVWARSHVCCLPSRGGEGLPRTLLEGAACGRAVVTTAVPGCSDFIRDGIEGLVVPPGDAAALAEAFTRLAAAPALMARMGDAARSRVLDGYTVGDVTARLVDVYGALAREVKMCGAQR